MVRSMKVDPPVPESAGTVRDRRNSGCAKFFIDSLCQSDKMDVQSEPICPPIPMIPNQS